MIIFYDGVCDERGLWMTNVFLHVVRVKFSTEFLMLAFLRSTWWFVFSGEERRCNVNYKFLCFYALCSVEWYTLMVRKYAPDSHLRILQKITQQVKMQTGFRISLCSARRRDGVGLGCCETYELVLENDADKRKFH